ncbi:putative monooxygenase [Nocardia nova SH22a]|uniref:Putative monooxygenase n=1 Tax=Nocardia nova SH22a TaxID=1415166 RepID=W5TKN7_9NOCA|nr:FAD-dependent monooxygenase [Nocardia nova]AHH19900.1 putative monooxygenase [Nocardia nova SH22a]
MKLETVAVLGGGPGGLYAARLLKRSHPDAEVTVYEQGSPDKTFGFGVGLASRTQRNLRAADSSSLEDIIAGAHPHEMSMRVGDDISRISHGELLAIARTTLLAVLQRHAEEAGVRLRFGRRQTLDDLDADLIVAADGVNSATRTALADTIEPNIRTGTGLYLWCGTDFALPSAVFTPVTTEHGTFVAHAYPYTDDRSTFLIETDQKTWERAGFDRTTEHTPAAESDRESLAYLEQAFAKTLDGHRLIGNRTRWLRFRTVTCRRWHAGNVVLLGDAAHTAHYSIGSGTKLAMEDAIALDRAIEESTTIEEALDEYERRRRADVEHLQAIAARSEHWWDSFPERCTLPVDQLMINYMTRAGKVSLERFADSAPEVALRGIAEYAGVDRGAVPRSDSVSWVLDQPLTRSGRQFASRLAPAELRDDPSMLTIVVELDSAWGDRADALLAGLPSSGIVWLTGKSSRPDVLDRMDLAERITWSSDATIVVEVPEDCRGDAAAGLASGRTHLVHLTGAPAAPRVDSAPA